MKDVKVFIIDIPSWYNEDKHRVCEYKWNKM